MPFIFIVVCETWATQLNEDFCLIYQGINMNAILDQIKGGGVSIYILNSIP